MLSRRQALPQPLVPAQAGTQWTDGEMPGPSLSRGRAGSWATAKLTVFLGVVVLTALLALFGPATAKAQFILVQSTTSTENSGLFDHILPQFTAETGIEVRVVAVGTGQAIKNAQRGDGDVLLVHARAAEERFVAEGFGVARHEVMYNDYVIVGPQDDPADIAALTDPTAAFRRIAAAAAPFVSRGDDSGTHKAEMALWEEAAIDAAAASGTWYREAGSGMGPTLNIAASMDAYALTDRATWVAFGNKRDLVVHVEGDERLLNHYGVVLVNPERHPNVKAQLGQTFIDWLIGPEGQGAIASFRIDGEQVFFPAHGPL